MTSKAHSHHCAFVEDMSKKNAAQTLTPPHSFRVDPKKKVLLL